MVNLKNCSLYLFPYSFLPFWLWQSLEYAIMGYQEKNPECTRSCRNIEQKVNECSDGHRVSICVIFRKS